MDRRNLQDEPESTLGAKPTEHEGARPRAPASEHLTGSRLRREEGEESEDGREIREFEESRGLNAGAAPIASPPTEEG